MLTALSVSVAINVVLIVGLIHILFFADGPGGEIEDHYGDPGER